MTALSNVTRQILQGNQIEYLEILNIFINLKNIRLNGRLDIAAEIISSIDDRTEKIN